MLTDRVIITGGSGLLALNWAYFIRKTSRLTLLLHFKEVRLDGVDCVFLDFNSDKEIEEFFAKSPMSIVIHCAAITDVDFCELHPETAYKVNVDLAAKIAKVCATYHHKFVLISSDHLFSGEKKFFTEDSLTSPLNVYGESKVKAEQEVSKNNSRSLLIRTNFFGWGPSYRRSFSDFLIDSIRSEKAIRLYDDIFYTPIYSRYLVEYVHMLIDKNYSGVFNVVGSDRVSKYTFGFELFNLFDGDIDLITKTKYSHTSRKTPRPFDMSLSNKKICNYLGLHMPNFIDQIQLLQIEESSFKKFLSGL